MMALPYTDLARAALSGAASNAERHGDQPTPGYLLLALLEEPGSIAATVISDLGIDLEALRDTAMAALNSHDTGAVVDGWRSVGGGGYQAVIDGAEREADGLGHHLIGTEHLLLGMLVADRTGPAALVLGFGVDVAVIRERISRILGRYSVEARQRDVSGVGPANEDLVRATSELESVRQEKERAILADDIVTAGRLRNAEKEILFRIARIRAGNS